MANDVVGYLVTWSEYFAPFDQWNFHAEARREERSAEILYIRLGGPYVKDKHLYKSVNGKLEEIGLSEGNDE